MAQNIPKSRVLHVVKKPQFTRDSESKLTRQLHFTGKQCLEAVKIQHIAYSKDSVEVWEGLHEHHLAKHSEHIQWTQVQGIHDVDTITTLGQQYNWRYFLMEDIVETNQRAKVDVFEDLVFIRLKSVFLTEKGEIDTEQISFVQGKQYVVSFQEKADNVFHYISQKLRDNIGIVRQRNSDFVLYLLLDGVLESYLEVIEAIDTQLEHIRILILAPQNQHSTNQLIEIEQLKQTIIQLKRYLQPILLGVNPICKGTATTIEAATVAYFLDIRDKILVIDEQFQTDIDILESYTNIFLSTQNAKLNEVMKVLTIISTIFIPLSFLASVYGTNFKKLPELEMPYAYPIFWVVMCVIAVSLLVYFRKKRWL